MTGTDKQILRTAINLLCKLSGMKTAQPTVCTVYNELEMLFKEKVKKLGFNPDSVGIEVIEKIENDKTAGHVLIHYAGYYAVSGYSASLEDAAEEVREFIKSNTLMNQMLQNNTDMAVTWTKEQGSEIAAKTEAV